MKIDLSFFRQDLQRKCVALLFALLIWFYVNQRISEVETFSDIPIEIINPNTNLVIASAKIPRAAIIVRGSRKILSSLDSKDIKVRLDIPQDIRPGFITLNIYKENITIPSTTQLENIITDKIKIEVDEFQEKEVPVRLLFNNALSEDYVLEASPAIEPKANRIPCFPPAMEDKNHCQSHWE